MEYGRSGWRGTGRVCTQLFAGKSGVRTMLVERHARLDQQVLKCFDQMGVLEVVLRLGHRKEPAFHFVNQGKELFSVWFDYLPKPYNYCLNMASPRLQLLIDRARQHDHFLYLNRTDGQGST